MEGMYKNWGKARPGSDQVSVEFHLLVYHCLDVAAVGNVLLRKDDLLLQRFKEIIPLDDEQIISLVSFYLAIHDIGKFSESFQNLQPDIICSLRGHGSTMNYTVHHDSMGYYLWKELWKDIWNENWLKLDKVIFDQYEWGDLLLPWMRATMGHHGTPPKTMHMGMEINPDTLFKQEDIQMASAFVKQLSSFLLGDAFKGLAGSDGLYYEFDDLEKAFKVSSWLMAGIIIISDWIGSSNEGYLSTSLPLEEYWNKYALPFAEQALNISGILPSVTRSNAGIGTLFPEISSSLSPMQVHVSECPVADGAQLFIIEDATGSGKTEAALYLAYRLMSKDIANGLYLGLPTMATSNAMYKRLADVYDALYTPGSSPSLVLAHGHRHLSSAFISSIGVRSHENERHGKASGDDLTVSAQCSAWIADNRKKALLADIGVGTIDQALLGVLPSNHQSMRLFGLSRNVLIVDEVHAYDPYMNKLLCILLEFHASLGGSAILLSATLPLEHRRKLVSSFCKGLGISASTMSSMEYPLMTHVHSSGFSEIPIASRAGTERRVSVEFLHEDTAVIDKLLQYARDGKCCCWIRNTVDDAIEAYGKLVDLLGKDQAHLFHARFMMGDRLEIEEKVLSYFGKKSGPLQRKGKVLIATQVVEQSLDIDFDYMVTDLAPIDLIFQRAGRLQRHRRSNGSISDHDDRGTPVLGILSPELSGDISEKWYSDMFPKGAYVYQSHGQLWLTAHYLSKHGSFCVPEESRYFIESVFGIDSSLNVPVPLKEIDERAYGEAMAEIGMANLKCLNPVIGYERSGTQWLDDLVTPTRLGDSVEVRLAKFENGALVPLFDAKAHAWELSQLSISGGRIRYPADDAENMADHIAQAKETMHDKGKWCLLIPMLSDDGVIWNGVGKNKYRKEVYISYNPETGLCICDKE